MNDDDVKNDETAEPAEEAAIEETPAAEAVLAEQVTDLRDKLLRAMADADNTRKRAEKDVADMRTFALTNFARDLLPVADNFARATAALSDEARAAMGEAGQNLLAGVEITHKELHAALVRNGVTPIEAEPGARFDPNLHQAAAQIPSPQPAGAVVEVIQAGWKIGDRVLRAAVVAVSAGAAGGVPAETSTDNSSDGPAPGSSIDTKV